MAPDSINLTSTSRTQPQQSRAVDKRDHILRVSEYLLETHAPEEITTSLIAKSAEIPVGSVYRYFPNVQAVLFALFEKFDRGTIAALSEAMEILDENWRGAFRRITHGVLAMHRQHPVYGKLLFYVDARGGEGSNSEKLIEDLLTQHWNSGGNGFSGGDPRLVASTVLALIDAAERRYYLVDDGHRDRSFEEALKATEAYLSLYLKG